jgi:hypothetical protein
MKTAAKRYFGMTQTQLAILGCLAFLMILALCVLGYLISSGSAPTYSAPPAASIQSMTSSTPTLPGVTETVSTTPEVILTPTQSALPAAPPAGWVIYQSTGVEIWLPDNFAGGDMFNTRSETIKRVNKLGNRYASVVAAMKKEDKSTLLFMVDKNQQATDMLQVKVRHLTLIDDLSLKQYINQTYVSSDTLQVTINENKKMTLLGREARRLTYQARLGSGVESTVIEYVIKDGQDIWFVTYLLPAGQILDSMPMIDQSIATFNIFK